MGTDVFLSVGKASTPQQEEFISRIEQHLRSHGLNPRAVDRTDFSSRQPLELITRLMAECSGTVVLAFERLHVVNGIEKRLSEDEKPIANQNLTTVWNQIEGAMAYLVGHPLLVIAEHGVRGEGLIEGKYDWNLQWVDLDPVELVKPKFVGIFSDWKRRVEERAAGPKKDPVEPGKLTVWQIIQGLRPAELWAIGAALFTVFAAVAIGAFTLCKHWK